MKRKRKRGYDDDENEYEGERKKMMYGNNTPPAPKPSMQLVDAFERTYEPSSSEHTADDIFTVGRIREYFQAYILPKMPDPLNAYLEELECRGYRITGSFDGSPAIVVRNRINCAAEVREEKGALQYDADRCTDVRTGASTAGDVIRALIPPVQEDMPIYTDDWEDDLSDLPPFDSKEESV